MNFGIVLQVRTASQRLSNKALMEIRGKKLLDRCIEIMKRVSVEGLTNVMATTRFRCDEELVRIAKSHGIEVFRGDPENVLIRYWRSILKYDLDVVARVTGDNPFIDSEFLQYAFSVASQLQPELPFLISSRGSGLPEGLDIEVFNREAIKVIRGSKDKSGQEHVTLNLYNNSDIHYVGISASEIYPEFKRLTIDYLEDLNVACNYAIKFDRDFKSVKDYHLV